MDAVTTADMVLFEDFRLAPGGLSRRDQSGTFVPVWIGSRALEILAVLVARSGELVTRDEIIKKVWPGTIVEYSNLPVQIAALRRILDEGRVEGSCIQTIPGRGYRFAIPVRVCALRPEAVVSLPSPSRALGPSANQPDVAPRLSIVVLPFANLGNDPEQQYFADGITDDLTTDLSRISGSFVIARNTTFTYMAKPADAREIGRELGVRYVLEGS